jgi:AcrR family transcriptional regulator
MGAERARPTGQAALTVYAGQGFEQTTVAEIARLAGLTERTFFRHFADKREVLFYGTEMARDLLARAVADAVGAALQAVGAVLQENPNGSGCAMPSCPRTRNYGNASSSKLAGLAAAMAAALRDRGVPEPAASLTAETGIAVFKVAFARWISEPGQPDLPGILRESMEELKGLLTDRLASSPSPS